MSIKKNSVWNLFGSVSPMLIGLIAILYIYINIGNERIGVLTIIWALIGYFSIFDFGLGRSITQRIAALKEEDKTQQVIRTSTTGVSITFIIGVFGALIGFSLVEFYGVGWMNADEQISSEAYTSFVIACFAVPITTITTGLRGILEGMQRFDQVNILKLFLGITTVPTFWSKAAVTR